MVKFFSTFFFFVFMCNRAEASYIEQSYTEIKKTFSDTLPQEVEASYIEQFYPKIKFFSDTLLQENDIKVTDLQVDKLHIIIGGPQSGKNTLAHLLSNSRLTINGNLSLDIYTGRKLKQDYRNFYNIPNFCYHDNQYFLNLSSSSFDKIENMVLIAEIINRAKYKNIFFTISQDEINQKTTYTSLTNYFGMLKNIIEKKGFFLDYLMIGNIIPVVTKTDLNKEEVKNYLLEGFSQEIGGAFGDHLSERIERGNFGILPNSQNKDRGKSYAHVYQAYMTNIFQISNQTMLQQITLRNYMEEKTVNYNSFNLLFRKQIQDGQGDYSKKLKTYQKAVKLQEKIKLQESIELQEISKYQYFRDYYLYPQQKRKDFFYERDSEKQLKYRSDIFELIDKYKKELCEKKLYKYLMNDQDYIRQLEQMCFSEQDHAIIYQEYMENILSNISSNVLKEKDIELNDGKYGTNILDSVYTIFHKNEHIKEQFFNFLENIISSIIEDVNESFIEFRRIEMSEKQESIPLFKNMLYNSFMSRNDLEKFSERESLFIEKISYKHETQIENIIKKKNMIRKIFLDNYINSVIYDFKIIINEILTYPFAKSFLSNKKIINSFKKNLEEMYQNFIVQNDCERRSHFSQIRANRSELERIRSSMSIKLITQEGGTIENSFIKAVIPELAIDDPKIFGTIMQDDRVTPLGSKMKVFSFRPHQEFNRYIEITQKKISTPNKLFFIKQTPEQEIFDLWGVWPINDRMYDRDNETARCYIKSFSTFLFIDMSENEEFQDFLLKVAPGLSYILTDNTIINKGFGEFRPAEERGSYKKVRMFRKNVKHVVLSGNDASGSINYTLGDDDSDDDDNSSDEKTIEFCLGEGEKKVFGSGNNGDEKKYLNMIIKIDAPSRYHVLQDIVEAIDENNQPFDKQGEQCELGKDGFFHDSKIIIGKFYKQRNFTKESFERIVGKDVFAKKGFESYCTENEDDFLEKLFNYDIAWIIGYNTASMKNKDFPQRVVNFYGQGKGLMLWEDDDPKTQGTHVVEVLKHLFPANPKIELTGNYKGKQLMAPSDNWLESQGKFSKKHPIFRGVCNMYEGFTICYPKSLLLPRNFYSIATASNGKSNIICKEKDSMGGRLIIDCACTKLFEDWWQSSIGTAVYIRNATCWLAAKNQSEITETQIN